jgi:hypothetical protein
VGDAGRATFFGGPTSFTNAFLDRGEGAFGDLLYGSCGFFQKKRGGASIEQDDVPYAPDEVAALVGSNPTVAIALTALFFLHCKGRFLFCSI